MDLSLLCCRSLPLVYALVCLFCSFNSKALPIFAPGARESDNLNKTLSFSAAQTHSTQTSVLFTMTSNIRPNCMSWPWTISLAEWQHNRAKKINSNNATIKLAKCMSHIFLFALLFISGLDVSTFFVYVSFWEKTQTIVHKPDNYLNGRCADCLSSHTASPTVNQTPKNDQSAAIYSTMASIIFFSFASCSCTRQFDLSA